MYNFFVNQKAKKKSISQVLKSIPNVGERKVKFICKSIGLLRSTSIDSITEPQLKSLSKWIESSFKGIHSVGFPFVQNRKSHIQSLKKMGHIKGERLKNRLPVRGQRTHTNAKTCKRVNFLY